jgi:ABC-type transport system involved in multi-copper enzyme maturation permease subunit
MTEQTTVTELTAEAEPAFEDLGSAQMPPPASSGTRRRSPFSGLSRTAGGLGAVGVKELRGRMRGRRAFVILSVYLVLLAGFTWMVELIMERTYSTGFGGNAAFASAAIGQGIFVGLIMLETLLVAFLAPLATAGSISLEREKQTLEMLAATPITSVAIVLGKLLSALIWVWLLIAASIPLTAVVFLFGGVAPDDVVHAYLVLVVTALGFGSFGLFCSSLVKRTQAATAVTIFGVLAISMGTLFGMFFWQSLATTDLTVRDSGPIRGPAPAPIVFLNPFLAQADVAPAEVLCAGDNALRYYCRFRQLFLLDQSGIVFVDAPVPGRILGAPGVAIDRAPNDLPLKVAPPVEAGGPVQVSNADVVPFGGGGESIWERTIIVWLVLSIVFLLLSVQFVSPTRRWRLRTGSAPRRTA